MLSVYKMAQPIVVGWYFDPRDGIARNAKTGAKLTKTVNKVKRDFAPNERPVNSAKGGRVYEQIDYGVIEEQRRLARAARATPQAKALRAVGRNAQTAMRVGVYGIPQESLASFPRYTKPNPRTGAQIGQYRVGSNTDSVLKAYNRVMAAADKFPMNKDNRLIMNRIYNQELNTAVAAAQGIYAGERGNFTPAPQRPGRRRAPAAPPALLEEVD